MRIEVVEHEFKDAFLTKGELATRAERGADAAAYFTALNEMLDQIAKDCTVILLVVPHCMQVDSLYRERMEQLGAKVEQPDQIHQLQYPFIQALEKNIQHPQTHVLNALAPLQLAAVTEIIYYENDPHLNATGQRILGDFLADFLKQARILE